MRSNLQKYSVAGWSHASLRTGIRNSNGLSERL